MYNYKASLELHKKLKREEQEDPLMKEIKLVRVEPPLGVIYNDLTKQIEHWEEVEILLGRGHSKIVRALVKLEYYPNSHQIWREHEKTINDSEG